MLFPLQYFVGFALNCNTDLSWFDKVLFVYCYLREDLPGAGYYNKHFFQVVPCGIVGKSATSISRELGRHISVEHSLRPLCEAFQTNFEMPVEFRILCDGHEHSLQNT